MPAVDDLGLAHVVLVPGHRRQHGRVVQGADNERLPGVQVL